jgi:hypothetical protein
MTDYYNEVDSAQESATNSGGDSSSSTGANCPSYEELTKNLDLDKLNSLISNVTSEATSFLTEFKKTDDVNCNEIKRNRFYKTAMKIKREMLDKHNEGIKELNGLSSVYFTQLKNKYYLLDYYENLKKSNRQLVKENRDELNDIELSDRRTYYELEENNSLKMWQKNIFYLYIFSLLLFIVAIFYNNQYKNMQMWMMFVFLLIYPHVIFFILKMFLSLIKIIKNKFKNVYLYANS